MEGDEHEILYDDVQSGRSLSDIIVQLEHAIDSVRSYIRVNRSSRVVRWQAALKCLDAADKREVLEQMVPGLAQGKWDHPYQDAFRALVDARMFIEIIEQLLPDLSIHDLEDLVSGNLNPADVSPQKRL